MTPDARAALIARAKSRAAPVVQCVAARIRPDHLIRDASREELLALVIVLAEAADPVRLRLVANSDDDEADAGDRDVLLLKAHAQAVSLRRQGLPVPLRVRVLDGEYHQRRRAVRAA